MTNIEKAVKHLEEVPESYRMEAQRFMESSKSLDVVTPTLELLTRETATVYDLKRFLEGMIGLCKAYYAFGLLDADQGKDRK